MHIYIYIIDQSYVYIYIYIYYTHGKTKRSPGGGHSGVGIRSAFIISNRKMSN